MSGRDFVFTTQLVRAFGVSAANPNVLAAPFLPASGGDGGFQAAIRHSAGRAQAIADLLATAVATNASSTQEQRGDDFVAALTAAANARHNAKEAQQ